MQSWHYGNDGEVGKLFWCNKFKLCFEGLSREVIRAEQPGFVIGGTGTEKIHHDKLAM